MTKATGVKHLKEFESRIFKYKGHSFDHGRTQGLLFKWALFEAHTKRHTRNDSGNLNKKVDSKHKSKAKQRWG